MEKTSVKGKVITKVTGGKGFSLSGYKSFISEIFSVTSFFKKGHLKKKLSSNPCL